MPADGERKRETFCPTYGILLKLFLITPRCDFYRVLIAEVFFPLYFFVTIFFSASPQGDTPSARTVITLSRPSESLITHPELCRISVRSIGRLIFFFFKLCVCIRSSYFQPVITASYDRTQRGRPLSERSGKIKKEERAKIKREGQPFSRFGHQPGFIKLDTTEGEGKSENPLWTVDDEDKKKEQSKLLAPQETKN